MNIDRVPDVDGYGHPGVAESESLALGLPHFRPVVGRLPVGDLDEQEGKIGLPPGPAPVLDQSAEETGVQSCLFRRAVAFPLVPDHAADRKRSQRCDHRVVKRRRRPGREVGMPWRPRGGLTFGLGPPCRFLEIARLFLDRQPGCDPSIGHLGPLSKNGHQGGVGRPASQARPGFGRRAAPRGVDQPDRHLLLLVDFPPEEVGDRRKAGRRFRRAGGPTAACLRGPEAGSRKPRGQHETVGFAATWPPRLPARRCSRP